MLAYRSSRARRNELVPLRCPGGSVLLTAWWPLWHGLPHTTTAWLWLAGLGSIHSGLAYVVLYAGMSQLRTSRVALVQFVYPLTAIVVDRVVYGHQLTALQTVGVLI